MIQNNITRRELLRTGATAAAPGGASIIPATGAVNNGRGLTIGVATTGFRTFTNARLAQELAAEGVVAVQLFLTQTDSNYWTYNGRSDLSGLTAARCSEIADTYRSAGLSIHSIGVYTNLIDPDQEARKANLAYFDAMMKIGGDMAIAGNGMTDFYNAFHDAAVKNDPVLLPLQQHFVEKVIDEVIDNRNDHVLFQVDNESGIGDETLKPDPYWARFARQYAKSKGHDDVFVCSSRRFHWPSPYRATTFQDWNNPEVRVPLVSTAFNFSDISQNNGVSGQVQYDNILWYRSRVLAQGARPINNVKCYHFNWPIGGSFGSDRTSPTDAEAGAKFWRVVFAGAASIRFHRHTPTRPAGLREGFGLASEGQRHLRSMREFVDAVHIFRMAPRNDLLSQRVTNEAYCLAEPGQQYAVFFTGDGDDQARIELGPSECSFELRWLDVATSRWGQKATVSSHGDHMLKAPGSGHWVAVLTTSNP